MANYGDVEKGDLCVCKSCGLELKVSKARSCSSSSEAACSVALALMLNLISAGGRTGMIAANQN